LQIYQRQSKRLFGLAKVLILTKMDRYHRSKNVLNKFKRCPLSQILVNVRRSQLKTNTGSEHCAGNFDFIGRASAASPEAAEATALHLHRINARA
jgi:hypothetical protein